MIDLGSTYRGLRAMTRKHEHVNWAIRRTEKGRGGFWLELWTPVWHKGRGPYLSAGLGIVCIMRGY